MSKQYVNGQLMFDTDYSTSEVKTGARWIDGKPIYRKVIGTTWGSSDTQTGVAHNIANIDEIVKIDGITNSSNPYYFTPNFYNGAQYGNCIVSKTTIFLKTNQSILYSQAIYIVLEYTKTTD